MARPPGHGPSYEVKRQEIIDLAAGLFAKNGYAATGIVEIGETVGLAKGALYYYIRSKENLLVEIQERVLDPLVYNANRIAEIDTAPAVKLRLLSHALLDMIFRRLDHIWVYEHDYKHLTGDNLSRMLKRRHEFENIVREMLVAAMEEGTFREADPVLAMLQYLNMHNHTYQWLKPEQRWDAAFLSKTYCKTLFTGFAGGDFDFDTMEAEVARIQAMAQ
ncbi:TetR/AcrR family transcriptional regulator [Rhodococcoides fascians A25f]|uniref:TetR/AcrR family transcriptional regulator n=1 Tax=Rhodococcoides fascians TaxID=1828 RepID=UPI00068F44F7|nr:TetR/AcrR family transcriptional regulator [Rhodococcus fascians]QII07370.1 TetR/AcrR family transcriptional regulator [Rhodococcus fascians A25f]